MTTQSDWEKSTRDARAAEQAKANQRKKEQEAAKKKAQASALSQRIKDIQTRIDFANKEIKNLEILNKPLIRDYNDWVSAHPKPWSAGEIAQEKLLREPIDQNFKFIQQYKDRNKADEAKKKEIEAQRDALKGLPPKKEDKKLKEKTSLAPTGKTIAFSTDWKYNAPMVRSAYFGPNSIPSQYGNANHIDEGAYTDARQAWKGVQGGRGTIQMDKKFLRSLESSLASDLPSNFDSQKYGFKFLYNPTNVSMAWGLMANMSPVFEASGKDAFQVVSTALMSSTISFELYLNRIEDFKYLDENGLKSGSVESSGQTVNTTTLAGISAASILPNIPSTNPYPQTVATEDLKEIYRKGTMYDIEYLLRTINGPDADFVSELNGKTSDRAWMRPTIVELHLGDSMRYRVRIGEFAVNHVFFNDRMVPTFSTVKLTCSRFNDGPESTISESTSTPSSGSGSSRPPAGIGRGY